MTHREVLEALSGLLLALFVAMLSSTVVSNALPRIVADLKGSESGYTWVVVATLLTMTASTPIWGKLADLFSKKMLVQTALVIYSIGSLAAAVAPSMGTLIAARAVQGLGVGGLTALVQVVIATIVSPARARSLLRLHRRGLRARHGQRPAHRWRDRRLLARLARLLLRRPADRRRSPSSCCRRPCTCRPSSARSASTTSAPLLITGGVSTLLIWVSLAGHDFDWASVTSAWMVALGVLLLVAAVVTEMRAKEPIIPLRLFRDRTTSLATFASVMIGIAMFGSTVYLSQYFQIAHGMTPTHAGLMSIAMVGGLLVSSLVTGRIITRTGRWKRYLVGGMVLVVVGLALLSTIDAAHQPGPGRRVHGGPRRRPRRHDAEPRARRAEQHRPARHGRGQLGGRVLPLHGRLDRRRGARRGAQPPGRRQRRDRSRRARRRPAAPAGSAPRSRTWPPCPAPVRAVFETAFGDATGRLFLIATPCALIALVAVLFIREVPLRTTIEREDEAATAA